MNRRSVGQLADLAIGIRRYFKQLSNTRAVGGEDQGPAVRRERALQEVARMADRRVRCQLMNPRAGGAVQEHRVLGRQPVTFHWTLLRKIRMCCRGSVSSVFSKRKPSGSTSARTSATLILCSGRMGTLGS